MQRNAILPPLPCSGFPTPAEARKGAGVLGVLVWALLWLHLLLSRLIAKCLFRVSEKAGVEKVEQFDLFTRCNDRYAREASAQQAPAAFPRQKGKRLEDYAAAQSGGREGAYALGRYDMLVSDAEDELP